MVVPGHNVVCQSPRVGSRFQESRGWRERRLPTDVRSVSRVGTLFLCAGCSKLRGSTELLNLEALQCLLSYLVWISVFLVPVVQ